jgi:hypothetical protein
VFDGFGRSHRAVSKTDSCTSSGNIIQNISSPVNDLATFLDLLVSSNSTQFDPAMVALW